MRGIRRKWADRKELRKLVIQGADVYVKWLDGLPDSHVTDEQMAGIAREALPVLSKMNDFAAQHGWRC